jgi:hypothetical protein
MYTDTAMNAMLFKNPLELTVGLFKLLHSKDDPYSVDWNFYTNSLLTSLEWTPYFPGSIFGRDGFDRNADWINANVMNKWSNEATSIVYNYTRTGVYLINNIVPTQTGMTMDQFITTVQDNLLLGRELPLSVKNQIKTYLTTSETGAIIQFQPTNVTYTRVKYP